MFRSPAESHPLRKLLRNLLRSYLQKVPPIPSAERKTSPPGYFLSPPRVPEYTKPEESHRMPCESATSPVAHTETLIGRLPDHPPGAFRKRHLSPSTGPPSPRKPPSVPRAPREFISPDDLRMRHVSRAVDHPGITGSTANHPRKTPRVLGECATCPGSLSSPPNYRKMKQNV